MNWEDIIKNYPDDLGRHTKIFHNKLGDSGGQRAIDVLDDAYEKLDKYKDEVLKMINEEDKAEAEKEFDVGFKAIGSMLNYFKNYYPDSQRKIDEADSE